MRKLMVFLGIFFFLPPIPLAAQVEITGRLTNPEGVPIPHGHIIASPPDDENRILGFAISGEDGRFAVRFTAQLDSVSLQLRSLGYRETFITLAAKTREVLLTMEPQVFALEGVIVTAPTIWARGDTIIFQVSAFARDKDFSIGDVINNMPGLEVTGTGQILFQGRAIQKFYIEGLDLMGGNYPLASRNLPHRAVSEVEVLQNHQPVRILENIVPSDGTSLNIRLKRDIAYTGNAVVGGGYGPIGYEVNLTPMLFSRSHQAVASIQANNLGNEIESQFNQIQFEGGSVSGFDLLNPSMVSVSQLSAPGLDTRRFLDNQSALLAYRHLFRLPYDMELKINANYFTDEISRNGMVESQFFLPDTVRTFRDHTSNRFGFNRFRAGAEIRRNSKAMYLNNTATIAGSWDRQSAVLAGTTAMHQEALMPYLAISNDFDMILRRNDFISRVHSTFSYVNSEQSVIFRPGMFQQLLNPGSEHGSTAQRYDLSRWRSITSYNFSYSKRPWRFSFKPQLRLEQGNLRTHIETDGVALAADSLINRKNWRLTEGTLAGNATFESGPFELFFNAPIRAFRLDERASAGKNAGLVHRIFFDPSVRSRFNYRYWTFGVSLGLNNRYSDPQQSLYGYVLSGHRSITQRFFEFGSTRSGNAGGELRFRDGVRGLFATLQFNRRISVQDHMVQRTELFPGVLSFSMVQRENRFATYGFNGEASVFFRRLSSTLSMEFGYSHVSRNELLGNNVAAVTYQILTLASRINITRWRNVGLDYNFRFEQLAYRAAQLQRRSTEQSHMINFTYYPSDRFFMGIENELYVFANPGDPATRAYFLNAYFSLSPRNSPIRLRLNFLNLLNSNSFNSFRAGSMGFIHSSMDLRPRQITMQITMPLTTFRRTP